MHTDVHRSKDRQTIENLGFICVNLWQGNLYEVSD
jgi:hypothetical protein